MINTIFWSLINSFWNFLCVYVRVCLRVKEKEKERERKRKRERECSPLLMFVCGTVIYGGILPYRSKLFSHYLTTNTIPFLSLSFTSPSPSLSYLYYLDPSLKAILSLPPSLNK